MYQIKEDGNFDNGQYFEISDEHIIRRICYLRKK